MTDQEPGYLPSLDSVLEAASLLEAFDRHEPTFGDLLVKATPGTSYALTACAVHAIRSLATACEDTTDSVIQQLRLLMTEVVAQLSEGEAP